MVHANGLDVKLGEDGNIYVVGTDLVIENPLIGKGLELDLGVLWFSIWREDQHNKLESGRLAALLLNASQASVSRLITILKEAGT